MLTCKSLYLQVLDLYSIQVPTKFGHVWWRPEVVVVTASSHPRLWYDYLVPKNRLDQFAALRRRFHQILDFDDQTIGIWGARVPADITGDDSLWRTDFVFV